MVGIAQNLPARPHRYDDWPVQPYWPTFIEKLLLSIIDAHSQSAENSTSIGDREQRLERALSALMGIKPKRGRRPIYDLPALVKMGRDKFLPAAMADFERFLGREEHEITSVPSDRKNAGDGSSRASGHSDSAIEERLRKLARDKVVKAYVSHISVQNFHPEEDDMFNDLHEVARILRRWNVDLSIDSMRLGMASHWREIPAK